MSDVFLSYARADRASAERLTEILRANSWTVWMDSSLKAGEYWDDEIAAGLRGAKCVVVLWSEASVQSHWVKSEAEEARQRAILVPARIDNVSVPYGYARLHTADLSDWRGAEQHRGLSELIRGVARILGSLPEPGNFRPGRRPIPWWAWIALTSVLVGALALLILHRDWTEVGLDVKASSVSFTTGRNSTLFDLLVVSEIAAVGVESLEIPRTTATPARTLAKVAEPGVVRLSLDEASRDGSITLAPMPLAAGSRASAIAGERDREFRIRIDHSAPVTVNVTGHVRLAVTGRQGGSLDFGFPKPMVLLGGGSGTDIAIRTNAPVENVLAAAIPVTGLGFTRIEERVAGQHLSVREISTVESGTLRLDSTTRGLPLVKGNKLLLTEPRGSIVRFEIGNGRIGIRFDGEARRVGVCAGEVCEDLSTTAAGWLWRQHRAATLAVGTACLLLAGLLIRVWTRS